MPYAEFAPVNSTPSTLSTDALNQPFIIDVPKSPVTSSPSSSPTTIQWSYPFTEPKEFEDDNVNENDNDDVEDDKDTDTIIIKYWSFSFLALFGLVWVIAGIIAFIMSLICFAYSGTAVEKFIGFLLAVFFGPFYWIYYFTSNSYCGMQGGKRRK
jgi:hypothetical protein